MFIELYIVVKNFVKYVVLFFTYIFDHFRLILDLKSIMVTVKGPNDYTTPILR